MLSQDEIAARLIYTGLLSVLLYSLASTNRAEKILSNLESIHGLLPFFENDEQVCFQQEQIRNTVQKVFEDCVDCYVLILRNLVKGDFVHFWQSLTSSSLEEELACKMTKLKINSAALSSLLVNAAEVPDPTYTLSGSFAGEDLPATRIGSPIHNIQLNTRQLSKRLRRIDVPRNDDFVGRKKELADLKQMLLKENSKKRPIMCAITGNPGIGKTETALHFALTFTDDFDAVFWISADSEQATETMRMFVNIGRELGLFNASEGGDPEVDVVRDWLEQTPWRWFIVFDNVIDRSSIQRYIPSTAMNSSVVLITSQYHIKWVDSRLYLEPLDDKEGSSFLLSLMHLSGLDIEDPRWAVAREISHELGGSPLFLSQAQGCMEMSGSAPSDYLQNIQTSNASLIWETNERYGKAASATHDRILGALSEGARDLVLMLSFMNPDEIREELFHSAKHESLNFLTNRSSYVNYTAELGSSRLAMRSGEGSDYRLRMHRDTQAAMILKLKEDPGQRDRAFNRVFHLIRDNFESPSAMAKMQIAEARVWPLITRVLPHVLTTIKGFAKLEPDLKVDHSFAQLLSQIAGMGLYDRGRILDTYNINKVVEKLLTEPEMSRHNKEENNRTMADALTMIGLCTDFLAISHRREGLEVRQKCLQYKYRCFQSIKNKTRDDKIWFYNGLTDLTCSYQQLNDFSEAEEQLEECFKQYGTMGAEKEIPYEYAKYYHQMAYILLYKGDGNKAVAYAEKGYQLAEKAAPGTQITLLWKFDWINILFQNGQHEDAVLELQNMLTMCKHRCGEDNILTLQVRLNLGIMHYFLQDYGKAEKTLTKAVSTADSTQWPEENIVRGHYYLSQVLKKLNPLSEDAADLEFRAMRNLQQILEKSGYAESAAAYRSNLPMLFDYLVHWECRLVTPRQEIVLILADTATAK